LIQFVGIARGSALEVQTQLELAEMLGFGAKDDLKIAHDLADEIIRILNATLATLRAKMVAKKK
jgi:four helix bundle protein